MSKPDTARARAFLTGAGAADDRGEPTNHGGLRHGKARDDGKASLSLMLTQGERDMIAAVAKAHGWSSRATMRRYLLQAIESAYADLSK